MAGRATRWQIKQDGRQNNKMRGRVKKMAGRKTRDRQNNKMAGRTTRWQAQQHDGRQNNKMGGRWPTLHKVLRHDVPEVKFTCAHLHLINSS